MSNAIGTSPTVMVNRIALRDGSSTSTLLAEVAKSRGEMIAKQAEQVRTEEPSKALLSPTNGAEVDLLV
jgi:hypothetical protein